MTDKTPTEELNDAELDNVQGGVYLPEFKKVIDSRIKSTSVAEVRGSGDASKLGEA
ncbi:MAG: bacteriocin [Polymorphobacter sp.]|uniref:bacteriocin n=1 Tax=Polymorphobacter sp. TaxID=1909290 RepID=UPI003A855A43